METSINGDVRLQFSRKLNGPVPVGSLAYDLETITLQQNAETFTYQFVVVRQ